MSPTYDYSGEAILKIGDQEFYPNRRSVTTKYYTDDNLVLISNSPSAPEPVKVLSRAAITANAITIDQNYNTVRVVNGTRSGITVCFNGDSDNTIGLNNYSGELMYVDFDNSEHEIGQVTISGSGTGIVEVINFNR